MHGHGHFRHERARRRGFMRPFPSRDDLIERLESYQRDLEQELANLDDVLRHLRGNGQPQEA
jgi:hypothetical protein